MDTAVALVLLASAAVLGVIDTYSIQRTYADLCADRHGHIPPLTDWFFVADPDPEVDRWRRLHRDLWLLTGVLAVVAIVLLPVRPVASG